MAKTYTTKIKLSGEIDPSYKRAIDASSKELEKFKKQMQTLQTQKAKYESIATLQKQLEGLQKSTDKTDILKAGKLQAKIDTAMIKAGVSNVDELNDAMAKTKERIGMTQTAMSALKPGAAISDTQKEVEGLNRTWLATKDPAVKKALDDRKKQLSDMLPKTKSLSSASVALNRTMEGMKNGAKVVGPALLSMGKGFAMAGAAALAASVSLAKFALGAAADVEAMASQAAYLHMSTDAYQELNYAVTAMGLPNKGLDQALEKMQVKLGEVSTKGGRVKDVFAQMGLSSKELQSMSTEEAFDAISKALGGIEEPAKRAALAQEIWGRQGGKIADIAADGGKALAALRQEARDSGAVLDPDEIKEMEDANSDWNKSMLVIKATMAEAIVPILPILTDGIKDLLVYIKENRAEIAKNIKSFAEFSKNMGSVIGAVGDAIEVFKAFGYGLGYAAAAVTVFVSDSIDSIAAFARKVSDKVTEIKAWIGDGILGIIQSIKDNAGAIVDAAKEIWDSIKGWWDALDFGQMGIDAVVAIIEGIKSRASDVKGLLGDLVGDPIGGAIDDVKGLFGFGGDSNVTINQDMRGQSSGNAERTRRAGQTAAQMAANAVSGSLSDMAKRSVATW